MICPKCEKANHTWLETDKHGVKTVTCLCGYQESDIYPRRQGGKTETEYQKRLTAAYKKRLPKDLMKLKTERTERQEQQYSEIAEIIHAGMTSKNLSTRKLAGQLGLSRKAVNNYLNGANRPKGSIALTLESVLGISIMQFYSDNQKEVAA